MSKVYVLIGVPASGKSTWVNNQLWSNDCVYISTDHYVEKFARRMGKTYSEVFDTVMPRAVNLMTRNVIRAREAGKDIIWDQTSTTVKSRMKKFNMLPDYYHVAVVFKTPNRDELQTRLSNRPGKTIPRSVVDSMIKNFEMPSEEEGFKEIWYT